MWVERQTERAAKCALFRRRKRAAGAARVVAEWAEQVLRTRAAHEVGGAVHASVVSRPEAAASASVLAGQGIERACGGGSFC